MSTPTTAAPRCRLQPFDYRGVRLDDGRLRLQFDQVREACLRIPNDDLLRGFRLRAGRPAPGVELGGWYSRDNGNIFGQVLSGLARMAAATGDEGCQAKAEALLHEWLACLGPDGFGFYSRKTTGLAYTYDKLVGGLVDMLVYARCPQAAEGLARLTDWAEANLNRAREYANADGEGAPRVGWSEWYTLSENLYRAYLATGEPRYREFAEVWEYTDYWDLFARGADIFGPRPGGGQTDAYHAYSHVNTLASAAAAYLVKGERHYLDTLRQAYDFLQRQTFATGGYGAREQLVPPRRLPAMLRETRCHFETPCGSWAAFKLCKYLLCFTGDARYGDWVERLVLNGIGAALPMSADGRVFYYSSYSLDGAAKELYDDGWACCSGTQAIAVADYHDQVFFHAPAALCVNLFCPASVTWACGDVAVTLRQRTRFPEAAWTELEVAPARPVAFALRLRAPGWLPRPARGTLNGAPVTLAADPQNWLTVQRTWRAGDTLRVELPLTLGLSRLAPDRPYPAALLAGPVTLAVRCPEGSAHGRLDLERLDRALEPCPGEPLTWRVPGAPALLVRPFYAFRQGERYFMYLDPALADAAPSAQMQPTA